MQTKPPLRKKRPLTGYQVFVKENFARVRREYPNTSPQLVMSLVALEYKETKTGGEREEGEEGENRPEESVEAGESKTEESKPGESVEAEEPKPEEPVEAKEEEEEEEEEGKIEEMFAGLKV